MDWNDWKGKRVYLVDDLIDTGATAKELLIYLETMGFIIFSKEALIIKS